MKLYNTILLFIYIVCVLAHQHHHSQQHNHHQHDHEHFKHDFDHFHHNEDFHHHEHQHDHMHTHDHQEDQHHEHISQPQQTIPPNHDNFLEFVSSCRKQLSQWAGFSQSTQQLLEKCSFNLQRQNQLFSLYKQWLSIGLDFNIKHFDHLRVFLKSTQQFKDSLKCLIQLADTENQYFNEQKKFKYFAKFVKQQPAQGKFIFVEQQQMFKQKGKKLCGYFKAFFQYYYLNILRPSQTLSTTFLRALTVRSNIFNHEDISYCVDIQTHGSLAQNLEDLDINNIYIKIPEIFNAIRYLKFKKDCKSDNNLKMMKRIQQRFKNIDMFKIMYNDYQPFVSIAAQKFGATQLKLLARKISDIYEHPEIYEQYSKLQL